MKVLLLPIGKRSDIPIGNFAVISMPHPQDFDKRIKDFHYIMRIAGNTAPSIIIMYMLYDSKDE
jgi:hypothetical protein